MSRLVNPKGLLLLQDGSILVPPPHVPECQRHLDEYGPMNGCPRCWYTYYIDLLLAELGARQPPENEQKEGTANVPF